MDKLLQVQELDLKIEACKAREAEIPKQKEKFEVQRKRLAAEVEERQEACKNLELEQRKCEGEIGDKQAHIVKYEQQLMTVKKNEEYQALLHEIDTLKKQISGHEERVIALMLELDDMKARLEEDKTRVAAELKEIDRECGEIDAELAEAVSHREELQEQRTPLAEGVEEGLMPRYDRIRRSKKIGAAVVPIKGESCTGCNMAVPAQVVNEVLAGKIHACPLCGRLLYEKTNFADESGEGAA
ncbi:MAG: hypothetical protein GY851_15065 [bacterium]|nr:hypothetical protein [bacterium]